MSSVVRVIELPPIDNPTKSHTVRVKMGSSSRIIHTGVMAKPTTVSVVLRATGRDPQMELIPVVFVHEDIDYYPGEEIEFDLTTEREFVVLPPGVVVNDAFEALELRGSFHYPQGAIFFLFEIVPVIPLPQEDPSIE